jgi:cytochrome c oxidase subunit 2
VGRFWSILFLLVPILGVGCFVCAMAGVDIPFFLSFRNHWLPPDVSEHGAVIDGLFNFILFLTGAIFIATGIVLFWFLWKYDAAKNPEPVKFTHGSHTLEIIWSILPAVTLLFIAIYQMNAWANAKLNRPLLPDGTPRPPLAQVTGRQFEWRIRYPGADELYFTQDDLFDVNELHVPMDEEVTLEIVSQDVLHSFFLPNMRVKQDVVPGMRQHVWFKAVRDGKYDIVCAELCGWGHYKMKGQIVVEPREKFELYLADLTARQNLDVFNKPTEGAE